MIFFLNENKISTKKEWKTCVFINISFLKMLQLIVEKIYLALETPAALLHVYTCWQQGRMLPPSLVFEKQSFMKPAGAN